MNAAIRFRVNAYHTRFHGNLISISQEGAFIQTDKIPALGKELTLRFTLGKREINCQGRVIYQNPREHDVCTQGFGVRFTRVQPKDYHVLQVTIDGFFDHFSC